MHFKTILFIKNAFIVRGIISYLQQFIHEHPIDIFDRIIYTIDAKHVILIIDREMLSGQPEFTLEKLNKSYPDCKIILISMRIPTDQLLPYIDEFIILSDSEHAIQEKIRNIYIDLTEPINSHDQDSIISDREREVLRLVALGLTNKEISDELCISTHTVITHRKNITAKLGIKTIAGLTVYAVLNGIISADKLNRDT